MRDAGASLIASLDASPCPPSKGAHVDRLASGPGLVYAELLGRREGEWLDVRNRFLWEALNCLLACIAASTAVPCYASALSSSDMLTLFAMICIGHP